MAFKNKRLHGFIYTLAGNWKKDTKGLACWCYQHSD